MGPLTKSLWATMKKVLEVRMRTPHSYLEVVVIPKMVSHVNFKQWKPCKPPVVRYQKVRLRGKSPHVLHERDPRKVKRVGHTRTNNIRVSPGKNLLVIVLRKKQLLQWAKYRDLSAKFDLIFFSWAVSSFFLLWIFEFCFFFSFFSRV